MVIAAENYSFKGGTIGSWYLGSALTGFLGNGYMQSSLDTPSDGSHLKFNTASANLNYIINFNESGTYFVHLRTFASDDTANSFFAAINGNEINYGGSNPQNSSKTATYIYVEKLNSWNWYTDGGGAETRNLKVSFNIPAAGRYTFTLYRRDIASVVDHIWLT